MHTFSVIGLYHFLDLTSHESATWWLNAKFGTGHSLCPSEWVEVCFMESSVMTKRIRMSRRGSAGTDGVHADARSAFAGSAQ